MASPDHSERSNWWQRVERTITLLAAASAIAVSTFTWKSITQVNNEQAITRDEQITDRYTAAVENLGHESSEDVRLGGIYALQRIMTDSHRDQPTVIVVLTAFVRGHAHPPKNPVPGETETPDEDPKAEIAAALSVLTTRDPRHDGRGRINLAGAHLGNASLDYAQLDKAILNSAKLPLAEMNGAHLRKANLAGANLADAKLRRADLRGAYLSGADLTYAKLTGANFAKGHLFRADMQGTVLYNADLRGVDFEQATLNGADLRCANLASPGNEPRINLDQLLSAQLNKDTKLPAELAANEEVKRKMASGEVEEGGCAAEPED
ncbi:pentapeptide repeat-containing protein [Streptomyces phaeochromogenes]|uniref:Pentapeptide repeat-containing protein n=1 Tax=Streptomyces phaeochromogenes TaxID=1923 RepID=A0ABZ1HV98_STRPH|nr:pentapeptide repeat-containing protein [Streptomyces phaeochromogenes]WSD21205.1 pentapeptide repeat-containing protein [Streptomyces phaeochromogenes]